jgi:hypothetical protein
MLAPTNPRPRIKDWRDRYRATSLFYTLRPAYTRKFSQFSREWYEVQQKHFAAALEAVPNERLTNIADTDGADRRPFRGMPKYSPMVGPGLHAEHIGGAPIREEMSAPQR